MESKPFLYYVWSSGLEEWEQIDISFDDYLKLSFLYQKTINNKQARICKDHLNRFIAAIEE